MEKSKRLLGYYNYTVMIISEMVAPFTLRIAISLRRCSHDRLTKENIPKTAIIPQTIDAMVITLF